MRSGRVLRARRDEVFPDYDADGNGNKKNGSHNENDSCFTTNLIEKLRAVFGRNEDE